MMFHHQSHGAKHRTVSSDDFRPGSRSPMGYQRSRALLVGLGAATGAFAAAAMMSAATAPTARADDFSDIVGLVEFELTAGQGDFTTAFADFSNNMVPDGLAEFYSGVDNDLWLVPTTVEYGTVAALTGSPIVSVIFPVGLSTPTDLSDAVTIAETDLTDSQTLFTDAATALSSGDYADAVYADAAGSFLAFDVPAQELLIGAVEALGL
jgi:hypothetical protein